MATPTWNQITAPNFSAGNDLIAQAMAQLTKATTGFKSIADEYKDTIQKRNLGLIQEYVNSAKTPEELESEGFRTGLARLTGTMAGEYDTLAKAQIVDKAADTLLSRKANQVSVARNEFGLDQDRLTAKKAQNAAELYALRDKPSEFEAAIQRQTAEGALDINAAQSIPLNVLNLGNATIDNRVKRESADSVIASALLDPKAKQANIDTAYGNLEVARKNAETNRLQAEAAAARAEEEKNKNKNAYIGTGLAAIDNARKAVKEKVYGSGLNTDPTKTLKYWKDESTAGLGSFDAAPDYIYEAITKHPELRKLPQNIQQLFAQNTLSGVRDSENFSRPFGVMSGAEKAKVHELLTEEYKNFNQQVKTAEDNATIPIYRKMVFEHAQKTGAKYGYAAAKDLGLDELTIYKADIPSQLAAEAKIKYASSDKSIPESQFIENEINIATNPDYAASNAPLFPKPKQEAANVPAQSSSTFLNALGTGSYEDKLTLLNSELKKTKDPIQIAFLTNELKKLEKGVPPVTDNTSNSLQEQQQRMEAAALARLTAAALKQNGQPPVTPTITAKPEEFKPRELTPAEKQQAERMNQEPSALAAQAQRLEDQAKQRLINAGITINTNKSKAIDKAATVEAKEVKQSTFTDTPLKVLADAAKLKEATLPVVPAIAVKPEEVKSRELTPAEKQQAERMTQTALSDLIGAKLEEKQALVRKVFPNASLTPIYKATELLGNGSEPLIQSMFKLPVTTNTPEETKPRELTPAEVAQSERMEQAAMVRLAGTKLKGKQAEVQKQFPNTPLKQLAKAATPVPSPLIPVESQNAFRVKENNLALDFLTGKGTPTKEPVPMPKVTWKEPVQAVTINPTYAQLPQHKVVATFVPDGDTINATSDTYKTKGERAKKAGGILCRVDSVDAPETAKPQYGKKGQPYGEEAAKILQQMVLNKEISIRVTKPTDGESNYGRDVCQIEVAGKDVSVELLRAGAAWLYKEYNHYEESGFDLESAARKNKLGLWGLGNPVYPPDFRHNGYQNP